MSDENLNFRLLGQCEFHSPDNIQAAALDVAVAKKAPTFTMTAYAGGLMEVEGYRYPIVIDLIGLQDLDRPRPALRNGDRSKIVGHTTNVRIEDGKVVASGIVSGAGTDAKEVIATAKNGFSWRATIGVSVSKNQFVPSGQTAEANGQTWEGPINIAREASFKSINVMSVGADASSLTVAATAKQDTVADALNDALDAPLSVVEAAELLEVPVADIPDIAARANVHFSHMTQRHIPSLMAQMTRHKAQHQKTWADDLLEQIKQAAAPH